MKPRPALRCSPLPGTEPVPRGLFVDRWGTLLELPDPSPCKRFSDAHPLPGAVDALFRACQSGWNVYLIGNEDPVAFGQISDGEWEVFASDLEGFLHARGVELTRFYACLEHPEGKALHARPSVFRLPDTGIFYHAVANDGIRLRESWVIGDSTLELAAGSRAGLKTAAVRTGIALSDQTLDVEPDHVAASMVEVIEALLGSEVYARPG